MAAPLLAPCPWRALRYPGLSGCGPDTQAREQRGRGLGARGPAGDGAGRAEPGAGLTVTGVCPWVVRSTGLLLPLMVVVVYAAEDERRRPRFAPARTLCGGTQAARQTAHRLTDTAHALSCSCGRTGLDGTAGFGSDPLLQYRVICETIFQTVRG